MPTISFKPKQVSKRLLSVLPDRTRDIIISRFGLGKDSKKKTLEAIGNSYDITRERVRQIENAALMSIRKSESFGKEKGVFDELHKLIYSFGGIVAEDDLLEHVSKDKTTQNHIHFFLTLGDLFNQEREDDDLKTRWVVDRKMSEQVKDSLNKLYYDMSDDALVSEAEIVETFLKKIGDIPSEYKNEEVLKRWLSLSKRIDKNPLGEYGIATSPNVKARGMRDYAFLVIRQHGSPMHFTEVAKNIQKIFNKPAHEATCHNELIKDNRFVLVGRGLYALSEWGYISGVVRDVIKKVIEAEGSLTKKEIVDKVLKERYVKENTIMVNLQNGKYFKKDKKGKYSLA